MVGMKVIRNLCTVVLLVQCAACRMSDEDVAAVTKMLQSYEEKKELDRGLPPVSKGYHIDSLHMQMFMLTKYKAYELIFDNVTDFDVGFCPAATMLACGEADVPNDVCLELLHRAYVFIQTSREYYDSITPRTYTDADPEPMHTVASSKTSVRTPASMPASSSRKRNTSSPEQELTAEQKEVQKLLKDRPPAKVEMLVEERQKVLTIKLEALGRRIEEQFEKVKKFRESESFLDLWKYYVEKLTNFFTEEKELKEEQNELERSDKRMELLQKEVDARHRQIQRSIDASTTLTQFPPNYGDEISRWKRVKENEVSRAWLNDHRTEKLRDIAENCYPEQFIVCGWRVQSLPDHEKDKARKECYDTIRKYNTIRRLW